MRNEVERAISDSARERSSAPEAVPIGAGHIGFRSEEHTSELQSHHDLVCRLLLEKKNNDPDRAPNSHQKYRHEQPNASVSHQCGTSPRCQPCERDPGNSLKVLNKETHQHLAWSSI